MCWNAEVSLQTFFIGILGITLGLSYGMSLPVAFFCLTISLMQFIEYVVWSNYGNKTVNYGASVAASALLWLQPVASMLTLANTGLRNSMLGLYGGLSLIGKAFEGPRDYSMTRSDNGHLAWNWISKSPMTYAALVVYMLFLFTPILLNKNYTLLALGLGTLAISLYTYWTENTWGSMWCWIVNGIVLFAVGEAVLKSIK